MKKTKINIFLSVLAISVGGFIYLVTRPDSYISIFIEYIIDTDNIRKTFCFLDREIIKNYIPDFLWSLGFTCALFAVNKNTAQTIGISSVTGIIWEAFQYLNIINGTGDIVDIIMYLTAVFIAVLINKKGEFKNEKN